MRKLAEQYNLTWKMQGPILIVSIAVLILLKQHVFWLYSWHWILVPITIWYIWYHKKNPYIGIENSTQKFNKWNFFTIALLEIAILTLFYGSYSILMLWGNTPHTMPTTVPYEVFSPYLLKLGLFPWLLIALTAVILAKTQFQKPKGNHFTDIYRPVFKNNTIPKVLLIALSYEMRIASQFILGLCLAISTVATIALLTFPQHPVLARDLHFSTFVITCILFLILSMNFFKKIIYNICSSKTPIIMIYIGTVLIAAVSLIISSLFLKSIDILIRRTLHLAIITYLQQWPLQPSTHIIGFSWWFCWWPMLSLYIAQFLHNIKITQAILSIIIVPILFTLSLLLIHDLHLHWHISMQITEISTLISFVVIIILLKRSSMMLTELRVPTPVDKSYYSPFFIIYGSIIIDIFIIAILMLIGVSGVMLVSFALFSVLIVNALFFLFRIIKKPE